MIAADAAADRPRWFALAFAALALNGAVKLAAATIAGEGWLAASLNLFGISAILWLAGAAGLAILWRAPAAGALGRHDRILLAGAAAALLSPFPAASAAALTGLGLWASATSAPGAPLRRAALIFVAITTSLLWGRLLLAFASGPLLAGEGRVAGWLAGTGGTGNVVGFADGTVFVVAPGCSSLQGVSLAMVFWVTVTQYFAVPLTQRAWWTLAGAVAVAVAVNWLRLAAIARYPALFDSLHIGLGATAFGWLALGGIVAVVWTGLRDALVAGA